MKSKITSYKFGCVENKCSEPRVAVCSSIYDRQFSRRGIKKFLHEK